MDIKITKDKWKKICIKYNKWCSYEEVKDLTVKKLKNI